MSANNTINTYNKSAKEFAECWRPIKTTKNQIEEVFALSNKQNPKVLELGCGSGRDAKYILKFTNDYLGMDASSELIKIAEQENPKAKFIVSKYEDFEFPDNVDIIFAFASLLHCDKKEIKQVLNKCADSLNKDGILYLTMQYGTGTGQERKDRFGTRTFYFYTPEEIEEFTDKNFEHIKKRDHIPGQPVWFDMYLRKK